MPGGVDLGEDKICAGRGEEPLPFLQEVVPARCAAERLRTRERKSERSWVAFGSSLTAEARLSKGP